MDEKDKEILEYCANEEPWHIVCGAFHHQFVDSREFIDRILILKEKGFIKISGRIEVTREILFRDAESNNWHENDVVTGGDCWLIRTSETGFEFVKDRFKSTK
jgi:hypothetical protein